MKTFIQSLLLCVVVLFQNTWAQESQITTDTIKEVEALVEKHANLTREGKNLELGLKVIQEAVVISSHKLKDSVLLEAKTKVMVFRTRAWNFFKLDAKKEGLRDLLEAVSITDKIQEDVISKYIRSSYRDTLYTDISEDLLLWNYTEEAVKTLKKTKNSISTVFGVILFFREGTYAKLSDSQITAVLNHYFNVLDAQTDEQMVSRSLDAFYGALQVLPLESKKRMLSANPEIKKKMRSIFIAVWDKLFPGM